MKWKTERGEEIITKQALSDEEGQREVRRESQESCELRREGISWSNVVLMREFGTWSNLRRRGFEFAFEFEFEESLHKKKWWGGSVALQLFLTVLKTLIADAIFSFRFNYVLETKIQQYFKS